MEETTRVIRTRPKTSTRELPEQFGGTLLMELAVKAAPRRAALSGATTNGAVFPARQRHLHLLVRSLFAA